VINNDARIKHGQNRSFKLSVVNNNNMADFGNFEVAAKLLAFGLGC
jgi:hypothetical protein